MSTVDWTVDCGLWTVGCGPSTVDCSPKKLDRQRANKKYPLMVIGANRHTVLFLAGDGAPGLRFCVDVWLTPVRLTINFLLT